LNRKFLHGAMMGCAALGFKPTPAICGKLSQIAGAGMSEAKTLYDEDFLAWSRQQAEALRSAARGGSNQPLDWENLAEEIESVGISQRSALSSQVRRMIRHFLKLEFARATEPRRGWFESANDAKAEIDHLLEYSPSLRKELPSIIEAETRRGSKLAIGDLERYSELDPLILARVRARTYTEDEILGDWFPPQPRKPTRRAREP
jgi:hypothetical protein